MNEIKRLLKLSKELPEGLSPDWERTKLVFSDCAVHWLLANANKSWDAGDSPLYQCSYCKGVYNSDNVGHDDNATGLMFCDITCEIQYDRQNGLPDNYHRADLF